MSVMTLTRDAERRQWLWRIAAVVVLIGAAYHYTLVTLLRTLRYETPLAYLGLVPLMSLALALLLAPPRAGEPPIHDRQVDYIVGLPLIALALALTTLLPARLSTSFWLWRIDLLSMPVFAAGVVAALCGVRALWRVKLSILLLLLAWPLPYSYLLTHWLDAFTESTIGAVRACLHALPAAAALPGPDGLFRITHGGRPFVVSIASACSGVDGMVGFLIVAVPLATVLRGRLWRKLSWLALGLLLVWAINVLRIVLILQAGSWWGQTVAISGLHPVVGLVLFGGALVVLVRLMPVLQLTLMTTPSRTAGPRALPRRTVRQRATTVVGLTAVLIPSTLLSVANAGMAQYSLVASDLGAPRLTSFSTTPAQVPGFQVQAIAKYTWAQRYFGKSSDWTRYVYRSTGVGDTTPPVTADVIRTTSLDSLTAYGVEDCYSFHHFDVSGTSSTSLGAGITGNTISYRHDGTAWETAYWIWPVLDHGRTSYERVVLLLPTDASAKALDAPRPNDDPLRGLGLEIYSATKRGHVQDEAASPSRAYLESFARLLIAHRAARPGAVTR